ncbi:MAG: cytochrome c3 family protein [Acidobacteriota bacterium]|nr:MAG: cytochrome c3 family protein [Acidobacteriota bacterium]
MTRRILLCLLVGITASFGTAAEENSCVTCHGNSDMIDDAQLLAIVESFEADVHAEAGLSCHDCHGGNPDPVLAEDMFAAMDEDFQSNPYQGVPERTGIPAFCGRCHSDPLYMRRYRPSGRVDQEREYWTSQHGVLLKQGDTKVATCTDCHGIHGIRQASNPEASV